MAGDNLDSFLRQVRRLAAVQGDGNAPDRELLARFAGWADEVAFGALVRRHGPMVLRLGRRLLRRPEDADDLFQATFLLLARKAASLRKPDSVACWLHGVTRRMALRALAARARRSAYESRPAGPNPATSIDEITLRETLAFLDVELGRLSQTYRAPLVVCYLEGATQDEAARQLGVSLATLKRRLARGKEMLRTRLARRGLAPSAVLAALLVTEGTAARAALFGSTVRAAALLAAGRPAAPGLVSAGASALLKEMVRAMWVTKLKLSALCLAAAVTAAGTGLLACNALADRPAAGSGKPPEAAAPKAEQPKSGKDKQARAWQPGEAFALREGDNFLLCPLRTELQRALTAGYDAHAYLFLDGSALVDANGAINPGGFDFEAVKKSFPAGKGRKEATVILNHIYLDHHPDRKAHDFVRWALEGFGREAGFGTSYVVSTIGNSFRTKGGSWSESRAAVRERMGGQRDGEEPVTGDAAVKVYPVRTELSRHLTGNADCVVDLLTTFERGSDGTLKPEVERAIRAHVANLKLKEKGRLLFRIKFHDGGNEAVDHFIKKTAKELAEGLGFREEPSVTSRFEPSR